MPQTIYDYSLIIVTIVLVVPKPLLYLWQAVIVRTRSAFIHYFPFLYDEQSFRIRSVRSGGFVVHGVHHDWRRASTYFFQMFRSRTTLLLGPMLYNFNVVIPTPFISGMSLTNIDDKKICHLFKIPNDIYEVVQEGDVKWGSGTAAEINHKGSIASDEI